MDVSGDEATASSYSLLVLKREGEFVVFSASSNRWSLRRIGGLWRYRGQRDRRALADDEFEEMLVNPRGTPPRSAAQPP